MQGLHLTADLNACQCELGALTDPSNCESHALAQCNAAGLEMVASHWHSFATADSEPSGYTGVLLLAESHLAVHTWPELRGVTLDVYVCNYGQDNSAKARALMDAMVAFFAPGSVNAQAINRG